MTGLDCPECGARLPDPLVEDSCPYCENALCTSTTTCVHCAGSGECTSMAGVPCSNCKEVANTVDQQSPVQCADCHGSGKVKLIVQPTT